MTVFSQNTFTANSDVSGANHYLAGRQSPHIGAGSVTHLGTDVIEVDNDIYYAKANRYSFLNLAQSNKKVVYNPKFHYRHGDYRPMDTYMEWSSGTKTLTYAAPITVAVSTGLEASQTAFFRQYSTFQLDSPDVGTVDLIVDSADASNVVFSLHNKTDTTGSYALLPNKKHRLIYTGSSYPIGTVGPSKAIDYTHDMLWNCTQIFKDTLIFEGGYDKYKFLVDEDRVQGHIKRIQEQLFLDCQTTLMLSKSANYDTTIHNRKTNGINGMLTSNRFLLNGEPTYGDVWHIMKAAFENHDPSNRKFCFTSNEGVMLLTHMLRSEVVLNDTIDKNLGLKYRVFQTPFGDLNVVANPYYGKVNWGLDTTMYGNSDYLGKFMLILEEKYLRRVVFADRDFKWTMNVVNQDLDGFKHNLLGEVGVQYAPEESGAIFCWKDSGAPNNQVLSYGTADIDMTDQYTYVAP